MAPSKRSTTTITTTGREAKAKATATLELGIRREQQQQQQRRRNDEYHHVNHHLNHDLTTLIRKGPWKAEEDEILLRHVSKYGPRDWSSLRSKGLLLRTGKSCRLRWVNKLRPNLKNGCKFSAEEERIVIELQAQLGNKWAKIATYLQGRTDNDVKNFWSSRQKRLARLLNSSTQHRVSSTATTTTASASSSSCSNNLTARRPPTRKSLKQEDPFFNINHHQQAAPIPTTTSSVARLEDSTSTAPLVTTTGVAAPTTTGSVFPGASSSSSSSIAIDPLLINLHFPLDVNNILPTTNNEFIIPYDTKNPVHQHYPCKQEDQGTLLLPNDHFPSSSLIQDPLHPDSFHLFHPDDLKLQQDLLLQELDPLNRFDQAFAAGAADLNHSVSGPSLVGFDNNNIDHDDRLKQMINPLDLPFCTQGGSCSYNTNYINSDGGNGSVCGGGREEVHDHKMTLAGDELSAIFLHQNHHLHPAVAPDIFFDDLPPDIFDQVEPLPSPPSDWS